MTADGILATIQRQAERISRHHTVEPETIDAALDGKRVMGIVSKGGSITAAYMLTREAENPFLEHFDEIIAS